MNEDADGPRLLASDFYDSPVFAVFGDAEEAERHDTERAQAELAIIAARRAEVLARYVIRKRRTQAKRARALMEADRAAAFGNPQDAPNERAEELLIDAAARAEAMHAAVAVIDAEAALVRLRLRHSNETRQRQREEELQIEARHAEWKAKQDAAAGLVEQDAEAESRRLAEAAELAVWADQKYGELRGDDDE